VRPGDITFRSQLNKSRKGVVVRAEQRHLAPAIEEVSDLAFSFVVTAKNQAFAVTNVYENWVIRGHRSLLIVDDTGCQLSNRDNGDSPAFVPTSGQL